MIASYVLKPDLRDYGLKSLALKLLGEQMKTYEELVNSQNSLFKGSITEVAESEITNYAAHDADAALRISRILEQQLQDADTNGTQTKFFKEIEMPLVPVLSRMEDAGIFVDANKLEELEITFSKELEGLTEEIYKQAGKSFNINSPKQLAVILFEELGLPTFGLKKTQSGFSTDANSLEKLRGKHDIADYLLEYREIHKLNTTYVQGLRKLINKKTHPYQFHNKQLHLTSYLLRII
jgi:DNA polymerase-1